MFHLRLRETESFLRSVLKLIGLNLAVPDHTVLSRRLSKPRAPDKKYNDRISQKESIHVMIDQEADDASQVEPLLDQIDMPIEQFTVDGAYEGDPTYDAYWA